MDREQQDQPTPRDQLTAIAGRVMGLKRAMLLRGPTEYNALLGDAQKLAAFVLRSDTQKGSNTRKRQSKKPANG